MEKLLKILSDLHPDIDFNTETELVDKKILDSFDIVTIVSEIMEEYGVMMSAKHIIPENFNSAKALYVLIERLVE